MAKMATPAVQAQALDGYVVHQGVPVVHGPVQGQVLQVDVEAQQVDGSIIGERERKDAAQRIRCRTIICRILVFLFTLLLVLNVAVWVAYGVHAKYEAYPWPAWVTLGTCTAYAFVANALLPIGRLDGWQLAQSIVVGSVVIVNILVWGIYFFSACFRGSYWSYYDNRWEGENHCEFYYVWPLWVNGLSVLFVCTCCALPMLCRPVNLTDAQINREVGRR